MSEYDAHGTNKCPLFVIIIIEMNSKKKKKNTVNLGSIARVSVTCISHCIQRTRH